MEADFKNVEKVALIGIEKLEEFYKKIGLPTKLKEVNISYDRLEEMVERCTEGGTVGNFVSLNRDDVLNILMLAR